MRWIGTTSWTPRTIEKRKKDGSTTMRMRSRAQITYNIVNLYLQLLRTLDLDLIIMYVGALLWKDRKLSKFDANLRRWRHGGRLTLAFLVFLK